MALDENKIQSGADKWGIVTATGDGDIEMSSKCPEDEIYTAVLNSEVEIVEKPSKTKKRGNKSKFKLDFDC